MMLDQADKELHDLYPGITLTWTEPGSYLWHEKEGIVLRLDVRYKGHICGMVFAKLLVENFEEANRLCVREVSWRIREMEQGKGV